MDSKEDRLNSITNLYKADLVLMVIDGKIILTKNLNGARYSSLSVEDAVTEIEMAIVISSQRKKIPSNIYPKKIAEAEEEEEEDEKSKKRDSNR